MKRSELTAKVLEFLAKKYDENPPGPLEAFSLEEIALGIDSFECLVAECIKDLNAKNHVRSNYGPGYWTATFEGFTASVKDQG